MKSTFFLVVCLMAVTAPPWLTANDSKQAKKHYQLGEKLAQKDKLAEAVEEYRAAIQLSPDKAAYHLALGQALDRSNHLLNALEEYRIAQKLDPKDQDILEMQEGLQKELQFINAAGIELHEIKPGGDATEPIRVYGPNPPYTDAARQDEVDGKVALCVIVGADGRVAHVRLWKGLGKGLDESAIRTVETWRYKPATANAKPVPVRLLIEVNFMVFL